MGRPTKYNKKVTNRLCVEIATTGKSLKTICEGEDFPAVSAVFRWLNEHEEFQEQYTRAKQEQADYLVEEMLDIADDGSNDLMTITKGREDYEVENKEVTNRSKLRVETRKWIASKLKPKKYGDKLDIDHSGNMGIIWQETKNYGADGKTNEGS